MRVRVRAQKLVCGCVRRTPSKCVRCACGCGRKSAHTKGLLTILLILQGKSIGPRTRCSVNANSYFQPLSKYFQLRHLHCLQQSLRDHQDLEPAVAQDVLEHNSLYRLPIDNGQIWLPLLMEFAAI